MPADFTGGQAGPPVVARRPDNTGPFILKLLIGLFVAMVLALQEPVGGLLFIVALAFGLWRWPRMRLALFVGAAIGLAASVAVLIEVIDLIDSPPRFSPTPTPVRSVSTPTVAVGGTPTLGPAARTATATAVVGQSRVRLSRAKARWLRGDNATALSELNDALTLVPGLPEAHYLRALVRIAGGDLQGATEDAERAVSAQPANLSFHDARAYAWLKLGRYDDAVDEYDGVLAGLRPENRASGHLGRGIARAALDRVDGARADLETGLRLLPDSEPDPQLTDLEIAARRALEQLPPSPASPSPVASPAAPGIAAPAGSPVPSPSVTRTPAPGASPAASPVVLRPSFTRREPPP